MTCEDFKNILLTESKAFIDSNSYEGFNEHIAHCDECNKYYSAIAIIEESVPIFNKNEDEIDVERISQSVLERIKPNEEVIKISLFDKLIEFLFNPISQIAYALMIVGLFVWYFHIEYNDNSKIVKLETRLNILDESRLITLNANQASYASLSNVINKLAGIINISSVDESQLFLTSNYRELLEMFIQSEVKRNADLRKLLENNNIDVSNGINNKEFKELLSNRSEVSKVLGFKQRGK